LLLGQLEGIWAVIYKRREDLEALHAGAFKEILKAVAKLDWKAIVDAIGTQALIDPSITGDMLASELQNRIISMVSGDLPADARSAWQTVVASALNDATAEGQTAALGILGQASGTGIDWELTAAQAKAALSNGQILGDSADAWIQKQTHGLGYQLSRQLASLWDAGASHQDMLDAIKATLGSDQNLASVLLDTAIGQSLSQGALATYAMAEVPKADYVTAGDSRVCAVCSGAEDGSPYLLADCPQPPLHPRCRCTVAPSDSFPLTLISSSEEA
jgi:SPP1 gp7 family putative phage head morphogenesis protein